MPLTQLFTNPTISLREIISGRRVFVGKLGIGKKNALVLNFQTKEQRKNPLVEIKIYAKEKLPNDFVNSLIDEIKYLYNFELDLTDFYKTFSKDEILAPTF